MLRTGGDLLVRSKLFFWPKCGGADAIALHLAIRRSLAVAEFSGKHAYQFGGLGGVQVAFDMHTVIKPVTPRQVKDAASSDQIIDKQIQSAIGYLAWFTDGCS